MVCWSYQFTQQFTALHRQTLKSIISFRQIYAKTAMASFRLVGGKWKAEVCKLRIRDSAYFESKSEAKAWASKRELEILEGAGKRPARHTLHEAFDKYILEVCPKRDGARWEKVRLERFKKELDDLPLQQITTEIIGAWRDKSLLKRKGSSVRREMELLRGVFEIARTEWKWITANPVSDAKKPPKGQSRTRTIELGEVKQILLALGYSEDEKVATKKQEAALCLLIALETAMRASEILRAEVVGNVAHLAKTKNGDAREVPLSKRAVELYKKVPNGLTISASVLDAYFRKAKADSKLEGFTFHDSRATALTRLAKKLDILDLARMVGHRDPRSLMVYYRETAAQIAKKLG